MISVIVICWDKEWKFSKGQLGVAFVIHFLEGALTWLK